MKYMVITGICLGGTHGDVYPGTVVERSEREAAPYVQQGRLRPVPDGEPAQAAPSKGAERIETREPKPRRRAR